MRDEDWRHICANEVYISALLYMTIYSWILLLLCSLLDPRILKHLALSPETPGKFYPQVRYT